MWELTVSLLAGVLFGLALAAPPGPMNALIAEESVLRGWFAGFRAGFGAMLADVLFVTLTFIGVVTVVEQFPQLRTAMIGIGGIIMCYFAYQAFSEARGSLTGGDVSDESHGFSKAFVLSLTNPYQILFWLTIGIGLLRPGELDIFAQLPAVGHSLEGLFIVQTGSPALLVGVFVGIFAWIVVYPAILVAIGERIDTATPIVAGLSGVILAGFGIGFLLDATVTLL